MGSNVDNEGTGWPLYISTKGIRSAKEALDSIGFSFQTWWSLVFTDIGPTWWNRNVSTSGHNLLLKLSEIPSLTFEKGQAIESTACLTAIINWRPRDELLRTFQNIPFCLHVCLPYKRTIVVFYGYHLVRKVIYTFCSIAISRNIDLFLCFKLLHFARRWQSFKCIYSLVPTAISPVLDKFRNVYLIVVHFTFGFDIFCVYLKVLLNVSSFPMSVDISINKQLQKKLLLMNSYHLSF